MIDTSIVGRPARFPTHVASSTPTAFTDPPGSPPAYTQRSTMKIEPFALERWMTTWETKVEFDIAESGIYPLTVNELLDLLPGRRARGAADRLLDLRLGYSEAPRHRSRCGVARRDLRAHRARRDPGHHRRDRGQLSPLQRLLDPGDHVVAVYPAYQQLYSVPRAIGCDVDPLEAAAGERLPLRPRRAGDARSPRTRS